MFSGNQKKIFLLSQSERTFAFSANHKLRRLSTQLAREEICFLRQSERRFGFCTNQQGFLRQSNGEDINFAFSVT